MILIIALQLIFELIFHCNCQGCDQPGESSLAKIVEGERNLTFYDGMTVNYTCPDILIETYPRKCQKGQWDKPIPKCCKY